jgi:hypothetical protein
VVFLPLRLLPNRLPPESRLFIIRHVPLAPSRKARDNDAMEATTVTEQSREEKPADPAEPGLRFEDPYWDDAFCAWWDPTLRTCC